MSSPTTFTYCSKWNHPICTALVAVDTTGRIYEDFSRLLFLNAHRGASTLATEIPVGITRVLQMLEASRNASRFADTIEYAMFAQASGIT